MNTQPTNLERPKVLRRATRRKGQGIVEFALVFPILIVTILAMVEFGMYLKDSLGLRYATLTASRTVAAESTRTSDDSAALLTISNTGLLGLNLSAVEYIEVYKAKGITDDCPYQEDSCVTGDPHTYISPAPFSMRYTWQYSTTLHTYTWGLDPTPGLLNNWHPGIRNDIIPTDVAGVYVKYHHYWVDPLMHDVNGGGILIPIRSIMPIEPSCYSSDAAFCHAQHLAR